MTDSECLQIIARKAALEVLADRMMEAKELIQSVEHDYTEAPDDEKIGTLKNGYDQLLVQHQNLYTDLVARCMRIDNGDNNGAPKD